MKLAPARVVRIFQLAGTVRRALLLSRAAHRFGHHGLGDALFARAMELRAGVAYPIARAHWHDVRRQALEKLDGEGAI